MRFDRRRALVTGGGSGIGAAVAVALAAEGARVAVLDVDRAGAERLAAQCGGRAWICDVGDPDEAAFVTDAAVGVLGGLDILVNAAGILVQKPFEDIDGAQWQRLFAVNLRGPALISRAALPALRDSPSAAIVNISSLAALRPAAGISAYGTVKAGLLMLTRYLALELAPVRVNAVCPGIVETAMTQDYTGDPDGRKMMADTNVLKMIGQPADIAGAVLYLASDEARFVTGSHIAIDGGSSFV